MLIRNSADRYGHVAQALHWLIAALIVTQFVLAQLAGQAEAAGHTVRQIGLLADHKSVGMTILVLAVIRVGWRFISPPPALPQSLPVWQQRASHASHWMLYLLLFALPISGWLMSSAAAFTVSWFGLFGFPDLVGADEALMRSLRGAHHRLADALLVVAIIHVAAALKHHFIDRDDVLRRMSSTTGIAVFVLVSAVATLATAVRTGSGPAPGAGSIDRAAPTATPATRPAGHATLPLWAIDYARSTISFTGEQAGSAFTGTWRQWRADLRFDPQHLVASRFEVTIEVGAVDTGNADRDQTMLQAEWFDRVNHPSARFVTERIRANADGSFTADALLTIKGKATPVGLDFTVREAGNRQTLQGTSTILDGGSRLDRLALALGTGQWAKTDEVGQFVTVRVHVEATVPVH